MGWIKLGVIVALASCSVLLEACDGRREARFRKDFGPPVHLFWIGSGQPRPAPRILDVLSPALADPAQRNICGTPPNAACLRQN